jgi:hypothetical protein
MEAAAPQGFRQRLQQLPRGFIYLLMALVVVWQLLFPLPMPISPSATTKGVYDAINKVPPGKLIVISADWDASTEAETGPQMTAIMHACFRAKKPFALLTLSPPAGAKLANDRAVAVAEQYGAKYGVNWCNWGYKYGYENIVMSLAKNIPATLKSDFHGDPISALPMMTGVKDYRDLGLVIEVTGLANVTEIWLGFLRGPFGTPLAAGYTAVMAPGYYPFVDSHQMAGMLVGAKGAAEMEALVEHPGDATRIMNVQSWAHLLIIALIVVGNLGYLLARGGGRR